MERYRGQYAAIQEVCKQYETDPANFGRLVELIQEVGRLAVWVIEGWSSLMAVRGIRGGRVVVGPQGDLVVW